MHILDGYMNVTIAASAGGLTITTAGKALTITTAGLALTITAAGQPIPVSVVANNTQLTTAYTISQTATISTNSTSATARAGFALSMGYDSSSSTFRRTYLGSAGDNTSAILFPGMVGYGIYNSSLPTITNGNVSRLQVDSNGRLLTSGISSPSSSYLGVSIVSGAAGLSSSASVYGLNINTGNYIPVYVRANDAGFLAGSNALETNTNLNGINGAALSASNPLPVSITGISLPSTTVKFGMTPVTYASSVQGTSCQGLTITAASSLTISNNGTHDLAVILTNSLTAPLNTTTYYELIPAKSQKVFSTRLGSLSAMDTVVHWYTIGITPAPESVSSTGFIRY
jgi:hypothetical protein